jgi:radical SAM-linked protein
MADIWLMETMEPTQAQQQLMAKIAPGLTIHQVKAVDLKAPALQTLTTASTYTVTLLDPVDTAVLQRTITDLLAAETHLRERGHGRKRKEYDLRPLVYELNLIPDSNPVILEMKLAMEPSKNGRPDEVLLALNLDPLAARIHRTAIALDA